MADKYGRRKVILFASAVTPIGILVLSLVQNLPTIYAVTFLIGLTYNSRTSTCFIFGNEMLPPRLQSSYCTIQFLLTGLGECLTALFFWQV